MSVSTVKDHYRRAIRMGLDAALVRGAPSGHTIKGVSTLYGPTGGVVAQWIKTKADELPLERIIEAVRDALADLGPAPSISSLAAQPDEDLATIFPVVDSHFGLYAWGDEAGEDYDLTIADRTNREAFGRLVTSAPPSGTAIILGLGDLLHADDTTNRTAKSGNALDVDTRHFKVLKTAVQYLVYAIEAALQKHARIIVRILPGNHDPHSSLAVQMALWAWYRNADRVTVDTNPGYFWWWRFGLNLLGATHGDMTKMTQLPLVMAATCPEDWGATKHRLCLTGHIHHKSALEQGGVVVESFQSTAARDAWHQASGFRSGRSMSALTLHREKGEISRHKVNIL